MPSDPAGVDTPEPAYRTPYYTITPHRDPIGRTWYPIATKSAPGAAAMVVTRDERVVLVRSYRGGAQASLIEFPRGGSDEGECPETTIRREVLEETGFVVETIVPLGHVHPEPTFLRHAAPVFFVRVGDRVQDHDDEIEAVILVTRAELQTMVRSGEITDGFTLATIALAAAHGL